MAWNNGVPTPLSAFENLGKAYLAFARDEPASYAVMFEAGVEPSDGGEPIPAAERAFDVLQHAAAALCRSLPEKRAAADQADEPAYLGDLARRRHAVRPRRSGAQGADEP